MEAVDEISGVDIGPDDKPRTDVVIERVELES
jgi:hypothetical protein